jgi:GT2 family glycosyltransferase
MQKIGVGITTYNRPKYLQKTIEHVAQNVLPYVDRVVVYNDGSTVNYEKTYTWMKRKLPQVEVIDAQSNHGVAYAKNRLFTNLMEDCELIFMLEDDVMPMDKMAIIGYLAAAKMTGHDHFLFAHHGPANEFAVGKSNGPVVYWPACVGAWCFYTKKILEEVGLMDENFVNAWEHVEHSWRIMKHHKVPYGYWPDVLGSENWLKEIPGSIQNSSIGEQDNPERLKVIIDGLEYWKSIDDEFPAQHTLDHYLKSLQKMEDK